VLKLIKLPLPSLIRTPAVRCTQHPSSTKSLQNGLNEAAARLLEPHPHYFCFCHKCYQCCRRFSKHLTVTQANPDKRQVLWTHARSPELSPVIQTQTTLQPSPGIS